MREILFRAKAEYGGRGIEAGEWVEGFYYYKQYGYAGDKEHFGGTHKITTGIEEARGAYQESSEEIEYSIIPETLGQYTGLTDNSDIKILGGVGGNGGKKMFEGDIVKAYHRPINKQNYAIGQVIFENGTFKIEVRGNKKDREFEKYTDADVRAYAIENNFLNRGFVLEVIGNIHDNPALLKGGAE